ncbi:hypothetical protein CVT25_010773 [Psilocybe cyanescens]|uniref:Uncharacterized protein n=1 Tax=Psilocybe cyanescens TaxID=93625 RepID=A0A409VWN9_PSICY|nr:hypothetical protein CVT25_010773 [Psilocybe cyanescens]
MQVHRAQYDRDDPQSHKNEGVHKRTRMAWNEGEDRFSLMPSEPFEEECSAMMWKEEDICQNRYRHIFGESVRDDIVHNSKDKGECRQEKGDVDEL